MRNLPGFLFSWRIFWIVVVRVVGFYKLTDAAFLTLQFPENDPPPPGPTDTYVFHFSPPLGNPHRMLKFVAENYSMPLVMRNAMPTTLYNVTVVVNEFPLPVQTFLSAPDPPTSVITDIRAANETVVSWSAPAKGAVEKFRVQLLTRDPSGNITKGDPMDWQNNLIRIVPLTPGGEYAVEVVSLYKSLSSEPARVAFLQPPATPKNFRKVSLLSNEATVTVQWDAPDGIVDSYYLSIDSPVQPNDTLISMATLRTQFQNLNAGQTYRVGISAVRGNLTSIPTFTNATTKPIPPTNLREISVIPEPRTLRFSWSPPTPGDYTDLHYRIVLNGTDVLPVNTTGTEATFNRLVSGATYAVSVEAFFMASDGVVFSRPLKGVFRTVLDPTVTVVAVEGAPELILETTDNSVKFIDSNSTSEDNLVVPGDVSSGQRVFFRDLVGGTHYMIYTKLLQNDVEMVMSFEKLTYPLPPINVSVNATLITTESVVLEWSKPLNTRFQGYEILFNKLDDAASPPVNMSSVMVPDSGSTRFNVTGLTAGAKYAFRMRTLMENIHSVETPQILQCARPLKPVAVSVRPLSVKLQVNLTRPSSLTKYYRVRLFNLDMPDLPEKELNIRNDSNVVVIPVPVDYLGAKYEVRVASLVCDLLSDVVTLVVSSLPPVVNFNRPPAEITQTSIKVVYQTTWPIQRSIITRYAFQINGMTPKYFLPSEGKTNTVEFTDLIPGTKYTIFAWTERGDVQSDRKSIDVQLKPDNMTVLNTTKITSRSIAFEWVAPSGDVSQYEVGYNNSAPIFTNLTSWMFSGLLPYKIYSIYVAAYSGTERGAALTKFYTTQEDKPGRVNSFNLSAIRPSKLLAKWSPPDEPNGIITGYLLDYKEKDSKEPATQLEFPAKNLSYLLTVTPGRMYYLRVAPVNHVGMGPSQDGSMSMPILAPVLARTVARPTKISATTDTLSMEFNRDFFSDTNGKVVGYAVIVGEDLQNTIGEKLLGWKAVQGLQVWPPYQAFETFDPFDGTLNESYVKTDPETGSVQVTIGGDKDCAESPELYCNGPLKKNTKYYVKLRAFSSLAQNNPLFTDTIYTDPVSTEAPPSDTVGIIVGICIPIILIVLFAALIVLMRKYNWGPFVKRARKMSAKPIEDKISIAESLHEKSRPVKLKDFAEHVRGMSADSDFKFSEEYEDMKHVGRDQACVAADLPVNRPKNRFTNILPYDHSRVKLLPTDDEEGSDYINANYVPGFNSPREFIVTQGPLPGTRDDFWRMIWEQNCRAIVMLTRCVEKGREKCDHYWPYENDSVIYGDVDVTVMNETQTSDWTMREFRVSKNAEPARCVRHFHFTAWPDFGVPERSQTLIKFVRSFRTRIFSDMKPIVVHCSAGVGRSGTFIALDRLLQQLKTGQDYVDIFGMVCEMRKERVWMVQTEQQYICIHQSLLCVLENREDEPGSLNTGMHENPCYDVSDEDEGIVESGPF